MTEPTYEDAEAAVAEYGDTPLDLSPLASEVDLGAVTALFVAREDLPVFDTADPAHAHYLRALDGIATEVEAIVGSDPQAPVRKFALRAIAMGVAAQLERSIFPEQQTGDDNSSEYRDAYLALLAQLRASGATSDGALRGGLSPVGSFPAAPRYPDPAERRCW
ncbi:hypothetical protein [Nocardioides sp. GY 10127]|uniref:hypothetical protein n=1 Tax=Nocardioides sp. GY 10127 TaxID=2569762 RepID=UPI0010A814A4|nr:hypothetical protein [Nocardioides sp. GY 10127]TIC78781.1 hypothetical protein E8D37_18980 [Nocardioides sp. GY 10127]